MDPRKGPEYASLHQQIELAEALLTGTGVASKNRFVLIDESDPDEVEQIFWQKAKPANIPPHPLPPWAVHAL